MAHVTPYAMLCTTQYCLPVNQSAKLHIHYSTWTTVSEWTLVKQLRTY